MIRAVCLLALSGLLWAGAASASPPVPRSSAEERAQAETTEKALPGDWIWITNRANRMHPSCQGNTQPGSAIVQVAGKRAAGGKPRSGAWRLETSGEAARIRNESSKLLLAIDERSAPSAPMVCQSQDQGHSATLWKIEPAGDGYWTICNLQTHQYLEAGGTAPQTPLRLTPVHPGAAQQQWRFEPAGRAGAADKPALPQGASAGGGPASPHDAPANEKQGELRQFIDEHFARWDRNHDGILDRKEIDRQMENPLVQGREAAVLVAAYRLVAEMEHPQIKKGKLLALADDRQFEKMVNQGSNKLEKIDRRLFAPGDPDLSSFHQGRLGDCFLLSVIAAAVHRNPQTVHDLIHPTGDNGCEVTFGNGRKVQVPPITDAELLMGVKMDGAHGIWLAVLEKAYGIVRKQNQVASAKKPGKAREVKAAAPEELLDSGGTAERAISTFTGHKGESLTRVHAIGTQKLHSRLSTAFDGQGLVCCGTPNGAKAAPGVPGGHCYAVFGYDSDRREVQVFNPWGDNFEPKGKPGLANGYPRTHGVFTVPLAQFQKLFSDLEFETATPARR